MFNLKKHTPLCRKKADKKRKSDNTPILSDSNDFLLNHKLLMIN